MSESEKQPAEVVLCWLADEQGDANYISLERFRDVCAVAGYTGEDLRLLEMNLKFSFSGSIYLMDVFEPEVGVSVTQAGKQFSASYREENDVPACPTFEQAAKPSVILGRDGETPANFTPRLILP